MAGLQASGLIQVNHEVVGARVKPINPAKAAMSGLFSCIMAQKGYQGPLHIFEGEDGYLKAVCDDVKHDLLFRGLGQEFEILKTYLKLYAACRHAHAPIDAALSAYNNARIDFSQIDRIEVETYPAAVRLAGIQDATTPSAGRFSIPFSVALVLKEQDAGADKYSDDTIHDEVIQGLAKKVKLTPSSKWEDRYPEKRGAKVTITTLDQETFSQEVELAKGEPENPASWDEVYKKFQRNAAQLISQQQVNQLGDSIHHLEDMALEKITRLI
jgi:2-methylcitrate dehydratase PrpD